MITKSLSQKVKKMTVSEWENTHWERSTRNVHLLVTEDMYLLAKISFPQDQQNWCIHLFKKYSETHLSPQIRAKHSDRAKKFTSMILGEGIIEHPNWQNYSKTTFHLHDRLDGELLAMLNFETETKRWNAKVLRREYITTLEKGVGADMTDEVKKLARGLVKAEPYEYSKILDNFKNYIEPEMKSEN
mgnify:CR=1 FL=1